MNDGCYAFEVGRAIEAIMRRGNAKTPKCQNAKMQKCKNAKMQKCKNAKIEGGCG